MALIIEIKVAPESGKSQIIRDKKGLLKCFLKSSPVNGKANAELIRLLSRSLDVSECDIKIIKGLTLKKKLLKITSTITLDELYKKLGLTSEKQHAIF
jgi:uncharacterized protein